MTVFVCMIASALLLGLNLVPSTYPIYSGFNGWFILRDGRTITPELYKELPSDYRVVTGKKSFGWPFVAYYRTEARPWEEMWIKRDVFFDVTIAVLIVLMVGLVCEAVLRWHRRRVAAVPPPDKVNPVKAQGNVKPEQESEPRNKPSP